MPDREPFTLASQFPGDALRSSNYRRLQHFFKDFHLDKSVVAGLATRLLDFKLQKHFALDRTNWKLGKTDINILVLVLVLVLTVVTPK